MKGNIDSQNVWVVSRTYLNVLTSSDSNHQTIW